METITQGTLLAIFEQFGDKAQDALDFLIRNKNLLQEQPATAKPADEANTVPTETGVYIISKGSVIPYVHGMVVGIDDEIGCVWEGHRWIMGRIMYGEEPWTKLKNVDDRAIDGIMEQAMAMLDWDFEIYKEALALMWEHIPLSADETLPTVPVMAAILTLANRYNLNGALLTRNGCEIDCKKRYWTANRLMHSMPYVISEEALFEHPGDGSFRILPVKPWK